MPPSDDFDRQLARSRDEAEIPIERWFIAHGAFVIPRYAFSGEGAPRLKSLRDRPAIPDLQISQHGSTFWVEVKLKSRATQTWRTESLDTGIDFRHWLDYRKVRQETGLKVFLSFAHEHEDFVSCDDTDLLDKLPSKRIDRSDVMARGGMIFWPIASLTIVSSLTEVRTGKPPRRAASAVRDVTRPYTDNDFQRFLGRPERILAQAPCECPIHRAERGLEPLR